LSRETGRIKRWIKEHSLPPIYAGRICEECKKFVDVDGGYCNKWLKNVRRDNYACTYFSPLTKMVTGPVLEIKITRRGDERCECVRVFNEFYNTLKELVMKSGLRIKLRPIRKRWIKEKEHATVMYEGVVLIFNPSPDFGRKLNELLKIWHKEIAVKMGYKKTVK
jgi:hypothetical protein